MNRPIRSSLLAAIVLGPLAILLGLAGIDSSVVELIRLLAVFFAGCFVLLLVHALFGNRAWRLAPAPQWSGALHGAGGRAT